MVDLLVTGLAITHLAKWFFYVLTSNRHEQALFAPSVLTITAQSTLDMFNNFSLVLTHLHVGLGLGPVDHFFALH